MFIKLRTLLTESLTPQNHTTRSVYWWGWKDFISNKKIRRNFVKSKIENINYWDIFKLSVSGLISIPHHYVMFDMKLVVRTIQLNSWSSSELSSVRLLRDRCTVRLGRAEWGCPQWLKEIDRAKYGDTGAASWFEMLHQFNKVLVVTKIFNPDITILICIQLSPSFLRFHNKVKVSADIDSKCEVVVVISSNQYPHPQLVLLF